MTDERRLDWLERNGATLYESRSSNPSYWVVVPEKESSRRGILGDTLRDAIDKAMSGSKT